MTSHRFYWCRITHHNSGFIWPQKPAIEGIDSSLADLSQTEACLLCVGSLLLFQLVRKDWANKLGLIAG